MMIMILHWSGIPQNFLKSKYLSLLTKPRSSYVDFLSLMASMMSILELTIDFIIKYSF